MHQLNITASAATAVKSAPGAQNSDSSDEHPVQSLYDSLTEANRRRADDCLAYLKHLDDIDRRR